MSFQQVAYHQELFQRDVVIVGGCGHVGLPLGIALASRGASVTCYDIDAAAVAAVTAGRLPFAEPGAALPLRRAIAGGMLAASTDPAVVSTAEHVIVVILGDDDAEPALFTNDPRASLSYRLADLLAGQGARVLCTDPHVTGPGLMPLADVLAAADLLVIGTPHPQYAGLAARQPVADIWGVTGAGGPW